jgi:hypothetical protein
MGFRPGIHELVLRPRLLEGLDRIAGTFTVHGAEIRVTVERTGAPPQATVDGRPATLADGALRIKYPARGSVSTIRITL